MWLPPPPPNSLNYPEEADREDWKHEQAFMPLPPPPMHLVPNPPGQTSLNDQHASTDTLQRGHQERVYQGQLMAQDPLVRAQFDQNLQTPAALKGSGSIASLPALQINVDCPSDAS